MPSLYAKTAEELKEELALTKTFQASQIISWLLKGVTDFSLMSNLSKSERARLSLLYPSCISSSVVEKQEDKSAVKLLVKLEDGALVECVMLSDGKGRKTACLSSQVGCAMGCAFCKTGTMGLVRNLTASEIIEQFVHLRALDESLGYIVFMGMGEPLANLSQVAKSITFLHDEAYFNISSRKITISTSGLASGIRRLSELNLGVRLAVSLVSADNETRSKLMRVNRSFPLSELKKALLFFQKAGEGRITLEYCMLSGVNTSREAAKDLARFTSGLDVVVNLIPWNPIEKMDFETPLGGEIKAFMKDLDFLRVNYTVRMPKGRAIGGACGQLATSYQK